MLDLGGLSLKHLLPEQNKRLPKAENKFDAGYAQVTLIPDESFKVSYTKGGDPVKYYRDLPELELKDNDKAVVEAQRNKLKTNPKFTDGDHILVKDFYYNKESSTLYLEAVKAKYAVLNCVQNKLFDKSSPLYTTTLWRHGVISPYITKDKYTCIMERSADKFYSAAAGFIQPEKGDESQVNFSEGSDLIARQGEQESNEEFLWDSDKKSRLEIEGIENRILSIRRMGEFMPVLEFISLIRLNCTASQLEGVLASNAAPDRSDHTNNRAILNLDPGKIVSEYNTSLKGKSGIFLYEPITQAAITVSNPDEAPKLISEMNFYGTVTYMRDLVGTTASVGSKNEVSTCSR